MQRGQTPNLTCVSLGLPDRHRSCDRAFARRIQGLEPRSRACSRGGVQSLAGNRTSLGFSALQGITTWILLQISLLAPLSLLVGPRGPSPKPQGLYRSSPPQSILAFPSAEAFVLARIPMHPHGFLALVGTLTSKAAAPAGSCVHLRVRSALPPRHPPFRAGSLQLPLLHQLSCLACGSLAAFCLLWPSGFC